MSGSSPSGTKNTVLDYLGLGLILAPPEIMLMLWITHAEIDWERAAIGVGFSIAFGSFLVWLSKRGEAALSGPISWLSVFEGRQPVRALIVAVIVGLTLSAQTLLSSPLFTPTIDRGPSGSGVGEVTPPSVSPPSPQSNDAAEQIRQLRVALDEAQRKLAAIPAPCHMRAELAAALAHEIGAIGETSGLPKTYIIVTAYPENKELGEDINSIFTEAYGNGGAKSALIPGRLPNYERDLDAPTLSGSRAPGITIHARKMALDLLLNPFSNHFIVRTTEQTPVPLLDYAKKINPNLKDVGEIAWIDVGEGMPWLRPSECH